MDNPPRTVFGFELDTPFPLLTARYGSGDPIRVEESDTAHAADAILMEWNPGPNNPLQASLRRDQDNRYVLDIADAGVYAVDPAKGLITIPTETPALLRETRLLGLPLLLCFLARGDLSLHAAAVETPSGAILIAAPGRHGKTSLAATFARLGCRLLTEDLCCLRPDPTPSLVPGPASLRVRDDMQSRLLPVPGTKVIGRLADRMVLTVEKPGTCDPVKVAGIALLKDFGPELVLRRREGLDVLPDLWLLSLHLPTGEDRARKFRQLSGMAERVAVWDVIQPADPSALRFTAETLLGELA